MYLPTHYFMSPNEDEPVDMDELSKTEETDIDDESEEEPDSTLGEETDIDEEADEEPDSELSDI